MKKQNKGDSHPSARKHKRLFRIGIFAGVLLALGAATVIARYASPGKEAASSSKASASDDGFVTVNVGGKKVRVNARTMQQAPLTQEQSQQIADALTNNKSTAGLVEVKHADGTVEMDLQGRQFRANDHETGEVLVHRPQAQAASHLQGAVRGSTMQRKPRCSRAIPVR